MQAGNAVQYPLGSRRRWIETLLLLVAPFCVTYLLAWLLFRSWGMTWVASAGVTLGLVVPLLAFTLVGSILSAESSSYLPWLNKVIVNLAYGSAGEPGIYFREWFRSHFVPWKAIARLEYWPDSDGRVVLHLYSRQSPIVFIPAESGHHQSHRDLAGPSGTVDFISQKLSDTWPGKSPFLICFNAPQKGKFRTDLLRNLTVRQNALVNAFFMLIFQLVLCVYVLARWGMPQKTYLTILAALFAIALIASWVARVSRKSRTAARGQQHKLDRT